MGSFAGSTSVIALSESVVNRRGMFNHPFHECTVCIHGLAKVILDGELITAKEILKSLHGPFGGPVALALPDGAHLRHRGVDLRFRSEFADRGFEQFT